MRLRYGYIVTCTGFTKNPDTGEIAEVRCTYDPATRGGDAPDNRKVKGTIHWVSSASALSFEARLYDHLFSAERPMEVPPGGSFLDSLNPDSFERVEGAFGEPSLGEAREGERFQFERLGYFCVDPDTGPGHLVVNRSVSLRDSWAKIEKKRG